MTNDIEHTGKIVDWNDARGFGFILDAGVHGRIFFHIKDVDGSLGHRSVTTSLTSP